MALISVIMPVYNEHPYYLQLAIKSILNQTIKDFEFIIINDASTNETENIILSYNDARIKYLKNENNLKITRTLNRGLEIASGKYIARIDSDDFSAKTRFEKQIEYLENNNDVGVLGTYFKRVHKNADILIPSKIKDVMLFLRYCQNCIAHSSVMFRKSVLEENNLSYDTNCLHAEDYKLWSDMSRFCKVAVYPEVLTYYRYSPNGISVPNKAWQNKMVRVITLENMIKDFAVDKKYFYSILVKFVKEIPLSATEYNAMKELIMYVTDWMFPRLSYPFNYLSRNYTFSVLKYFICADV